MLIPSEMGAWAGTIAAAEARLRQEQVRPWVPLLSVAFSAGDFGGGGTLIGYRFAHFSGRTDFSALDYATDAALRAALAEETSEATVVIVAQRVATIRDADRIVVLDEGRVVGTGTHRELMADNETYREIVLSQLTEAEAA